MEHRPRNYGEPTDRGYEKAMDAQTDWIAFSRNRGKKFRGFHAAMAAQVDAQLESEYSYDENYRYHELEYDAAAEGLKVAEPFWVTSEVCQLLDAARHTLPAVELLPSDLLVPNGFVAFEESVPDFHEGGTGLKAMAWTSWKHEGQGKVLATAFVDVPLVQEVRFPGEGEIADYEFPLARLLVAFWLLTKQRLLVSSPREVSRAVRRRAKREINNVVVVDLRRREYPETDGQRKVDWTHRWLVGGFWRNQWYPSEGRHRPIWIADFVKGPPDKPFVAKHRAFEVVR